MPFSAYRDNFDAETLAILEAAFNEAWEVVTASGGPLLVSDNAASPHMRATCPNVSIPAGKRTVRQFGVDVDQAGR